MSDPDVRDAVDRTVPAAIQHIQILVVYILVSAVRRLDVIHKELRRRDTLTKRLADDAAFLGLYVRQFPSISR